MELKRTSTCALAVLVATAATAAPREIVLPAETATWRPLALPGAQLAARACVVCHSADYISYQPPGMSLAQWTGEVAKMQHAYGAPVSDREVTLIGAYLAVAYGSSKLDDADVIAASRAEGLPTSGHTATSSDLTAGTVDAKSLLNAKGCLACHAFDKKLVGPAYHDVASRYYGDSAAVGKVTKSILDGSSGRWGPVPMPPNTGLTDGEAKELADLVLKQ